MESLTGARAASVSPFAPIKLLGCTGRVGAGVLLLGAPALLRLLHGVLPLKI